MRKPIKANIVRPVQNFRQFAKDTADEATGLVAILEGIHGEFDKFKERDWRSLHHLFYDHGDGVDYGDFKWGMDGFGGDDHRGYHSRITNSLKGISEEFRSLLVTTRDDRPDRPDPGLVRMLISDAIDKARSGMHRFADPRVVDTLEKTKRFLESGDLEKSWSNEFGDDDPALPIAVGLVGDFLTAYMKAHLLFQRVMEHGSAVLYLLTGKEPPHENTEILYHASIDARNLYQDGFSKKGPAKAKGIGQLGGVLKTTSFTSAEWLTEEIARALLEASYIAKGVIGMSDVLEHAKRDGILRDVQRTFWGIHGCAPDDPNVFSDRLHIMDAYRYYLSYAEKKEKRYDPLFTGNIEELLIILKNASLDNIGYVAARVDMTHSGIEYLSSMYEYRVPPTAILGNEYWVQAETDWV